METNAEENCNFNKPNSNKCTTSKILPLISYLLVILISFDVLGQANASCYGLDEGNIGLSAPKPKEPKNRELNFWDSWDLFSFDYMEEPLNVTQGVKYLTKLLNESTFSNIQLSELSQVLGNRPAALRLAAGVLNNKKISLEDYIRKVNQTEKDNSELTENEKEIEKAMSISVELIKDEGSNLAFKILLLLGYMPISHYTKQDFLQAVTNKSFIEVDQATDLLKKYSLLVKEKENHYSKVGARLMVLYRFFLPVIRFLGRSEENETLEMILSTKGFLEYKESPFYHSNKILQDKYPEIRAQLIDQPKLKQLIQNKEYDEAVKLSFNIHNVMKTPESLFNHAQSLQLGGNITEAIKVLKCLSVQVTLTFPDPKSLIKHFGEGGIVDIVYGRVDKRFINGYLIAFYLLEGNEKSAVELLKTETVTFIQISNKVLLKIIQLLNNKHIENYKLRRGLLDKFIDFEVGTEGAGNKIDLDFISSLSKDIQFPNNLKDLRLVWPLFFNGEEKLEEFDVSHLIGPNLKTFHLSSHHLVTKLNISFQKLASVPEVFLGNEIRILLQENTKISPKILELEEVIFFVNGSEVEQIFVNDFVDFSQIEDLKLLKAFVGQPRMKIDLSNSSISVKNLELTNVEVVDWEKSAWKTKKLYLRNMNYLKKNKMEIREFEAHSSIINLSVLPNSIERIIFRNYINLEQNGTVNLPKLNHLKWIVRGLDTSNLNLFSNCTNLTELDFGDGPTISLKGNDVPKSVKKIKYYNVEITGDEELQIETMVLDWQWHYPSWEISNKLKAKHLVILTGRIVSEDEMDQLYGLLKRFKIVTIGQFNWDDINFESTELAKLVDKKAEYYTFENGKGKAIEDADFQKLFNF